MKRYYEKAFVRKQQLLAEYTNRIVALNNQHYKEIEDLCRENNLKISQIRPSAELIEYEKNMKQTYVRMKHLFDNITRYREYNRKGLDMTPYVLEFNESLVPENFPNIPRKRVKLVFKYKNTGICKGVITGGAADIENSNQQDIENTDEKTLENTTIQEEQEENPTMLQGGVYYCHYSE